MLVSAWYTKNFSKPTGGQREKCYFPPSTAPQKVQRVKPDHSEMFEQRERRTKTFPKKGIKNDSPSRAKKMTPRDQFIPPRSVVAVIETLNKE